MAEQPLGVGIVGLGFGGRVHVPAFQLLEPVGARVVTVSSRDPVRGRAVAAAHGVERWTPSWRELVDEPDLDLVSVATPPASHAEIALAALRAGKAVLCEKPLTLTVAEAETLAAAAAGRTALVNFSYRALPAFRLASRLIAEGRLGEVERVQVIWTARPRAEVGWVWSWKDSADEGGGALAGYGVHALDYVAWLVAPILRASGRVEPGSGSRRGADGSSHAITADRAFTASLLLAGGAEATVHVSLTGEENRHRVEIAGTRGRLVLENLDSTDPVRAFTIRLDGRVLDPGGPMWPAPPGTDPRVEPLAAHAAALVEALRAGRGVEPSFRDGARAQAALDALRAAARTGRAHAVAAEKKPHRSLGSAAQ